MILRPFVFVFALALAALAQSQTPGFDFVEKISIYEMKAVQGRLKFAESEKSGYYDLIYQRMEWEINPGVRFIKGIVTSYFRSKISSLDKVEFDLENSMSIDSVFYNGKKAPYTRLGNKFEVQLSKALHANETDSVKIFYRGTPLNSSFGSFTKSTHNGTPVIWTLSEPYGAMEWWPCKQTLTDKIDSIDIIVKTPEAYRTASNGMLVAENVSQGYRTMHWKHRYPIATYLVAIAVTNYVNYSDFLTKSDGKKLEILNFVYPESLDNARANTPATVDLIALFNRLIGEYPFSRERYGHAQFGWGGGMEHQTMTFVTDFSFELVAHELAHQWFGDYITLGSWHDIWLNEGFATYMSGLAYENLLDGKWWYPFKSSNLARIVSQPAGSVYVKDTTNINTLFSSRLSYSKGAYLLHMLRWVMGDEKFFRGLKNYFNDPAVANGFATNKQFVRHMEIAGDTTLTEFFNDWYYGEGFPVYSSTFYRLGNGTVKINLLQTPSHASVSFFEMPVPVRFYNENKTDSIDFRLINTVNNQNFTVKTRFEPFSMKIDPDLWLVSKTLKTTGVNLQEEEKNISLYPNPTTGVVKLGLLGTLQTTDVNVYNALGVKTGVILKDGNKLDFSTQAPGFYVVQIKNKSYSVEYKVVKK